MTNKREIDVAATRDYQIAALKQELHEARKRARQANTRADIAETKLRTFKAAIRDKASGQWVYEEWGQ